MKYKWIALVLACVLLLSGCRQTETGGSVHNDTDTTAATVTGITTTDTTVINTTSGSTERNTSPVTTSSKKANTTITPYKTTYFKTWEAYGDALQGVRTREDLEALFSPNYRKVSAMPMFLEDRFFVLPASKEHFRESCALESQGYTMFLFVSEEKCSATVEIAHHKELFSQYNSSWHREEPYTTDSGLEVTAYTTEPSRKVYYTTVYGYPIRIDTYDACACIDDFVNTLTFEKVEMK